MNIDNLWVGDTVIIIKSQRTGRFEGKHKSGKAIVLWNDKILLIPAEGLSLAPELKVDKLTEHGFSSKHSRNAKKGGYQYDEKLSFIPRIDLHINKLQPEKERENPIAILEFQLRKLREFMEKAIELKTYKVEIIHGRGTGALKMETYNELENYPEKVSLIPINNEGGVLVYLKYS